MPVALHSSRYDASMAIYSLWIRSVREMGSKEFPSWHFVQGSAELSLKNKRWQLGFLNVYILVIFKVNKL